MIVGSNYFASGPVVSGSNNLQGTRFCGAYKPMFNRLSSGTATRLCPPRFPRIQSICFHINQKSFGLLHMDFWNTFGPLDRDRRRVLVGPRQYLRSSCNPWSHDSHNRVVASVAALRRWAAPMKQGWQVRRVRIHRYCYEGLLVLRLKRNVWCLRSDINGQLPPAAAPARIHPTQNRLKSGFRGLK